jgi:hypothetical protein
MHLCAATPMHFLSAVDTCNLIRLPKLLEAT